MERFATDFDGLPEIISGAPAGRVLIVAGLLVQAFAVYGILMTDGAVALVGITIDN